MSTDRISNGSRDIQEQRLQGAGVTRRALIIGLLYVLFLAYLNPRSIGKLLPRIDLEGAPPSAALAIVFLMLLFNLVIKRKELRFSVQEMITVYVMAMLGGLIVGRGFVAFFSISVMAPHMLSLANPQLYGGFLDSLSEVIIPKNPDTVRGFLQGSSEGVPWGEWIVPLLVWTCFFTVVFWVMLCILTIVRKQWVEHERLGFPLVTAVMPLVEKTQEGEIPFWKNKLLYLGLIYPILYEGLQRVNMYYPAVPMIPDAIYLFGSLSTTFPYNVLKDVVLRPRPFMIGVGYLLPLDMLFSMWFFYYVQKATHLYYNITGVYDWYHHTLFRLQGMAGFVVISVVALWFSRDQLKNIIKKGLKANAKVNDEEEPISFGVAFWSMTLGGLFIILFGWVFLHIHPLWLIIYFLLFFAAALAFTKIRAEAGYPYTHCIPIQIDRTLAETVAGTTLRDTAMGLGYFFTLTYGFFGAGSSIALESYKFSDRVGIHNRTMTKIMLLVVVFAMITGFVSTLIMYYDIGVNSIEPFYTSSSTDVAFDWAKNVYRRTNVKNMMEFGKGLVIASILTFLRTKYVWWPFHPIGYAIANTDYMTPFWGGFFIAWLAKFVILRYGGPKLAQKLLPFFIGMIVGTAMTHAVGAVIAAIAQLF